MAETFTVGSGNVFADLGLPNPEEALLKSKLAHGASIAIRDLGLSERAAARFLGIDLAELRDLLRGRLGCFSVEQLRSFNVDLARRAGLE